jgi:hypothetical protein
MSVVQIERIDQERRRAMRVEEEVRAYVTERRKTSPVPGMDEFLAPLFGRSLNLSESGILLELDECLAPGRRVEVGIELDGRKLVLPGIVARVLRPKKSDRVHVGIRFLDIGKEDQETIVRLVEAGRLVPYLN